jgi:hypothetical protein
VIATGDIAYANARMRALKSQLLDADAVRPLRVPEGRATAAIANLPADRFCQLLRCYGVVLRCYPSGKDLFRTLFALHEMENLKLAWRALVRSRPFDLWRSLWRPLGVLGTIQLDTCRERTSLADLVSSLRKTPYADIANSVLRAHANDLTAAELAFDRWASAGIASAAASLGAGETATRELAFALVRERDLNLLRRGVRAFRLSPDAVLGSLVLLPRELPSDDLARLATWTSEEGRILPMWPKSWKAGPQLPADWDSLLVAIRRARRRACRRAFLGSPYCLAPAVALLLLQAEEVRGLEAIRDSAGNPEDAPVLDRVLAASALGA